MIDCNNVRKIVINFLNNDGTVTTSTIYFDISTEQQITERQAQQCTNIQSINFSCAKACFLE